MAAKEIVQRLVCVCSEGLKTVVVWNEIYDLFT